MLLAGHLLSQCGETTNVLSGARERESEGDRGERRKRGSEGTCWFKFSAKQDFQQLPNSLPANNPSRKSAPPNTHKHTASQEVDAREAVSAALPIFPQQRHNRINTECRKLPGPQNTPRAPPHFIPERWSTYFSTLKMSPEFILSSLMAFK